MKRFIYLVTILGSFSSFSVDSDPSKPCAHCEEKAVRGNPFNANRYPNE